MEQASNFEEENQQPSAEEYRDAKDRVFNLVKVNLEIEDIIKISSIFPLPAAGRLFYN